MSGSFFWIVPAPTPPADLWAERELTYEFRQEVQHREEFAAYCQWYYQTARQHQREAAKMQHDINLFRWFYRR